MPKGVPKNGLWHGRERLDEWLKRQEPRPCACGCGELVIPKKEQRHRGGIPQFVLGHHARVRHYNYKAVDKWAEEQQGRHLCACGCRQAIRIEKRHHSTGIPRYLRNHHPAPYIGHGPDHPSYIKDRSLVKSRRGKGHFSEHTMRLIWARCERKCMRCGSTRRVEYDHIIPIFMGGSNEFENGRLRCIDCHQLKSWLERVASRSDGYGRVRFMRSLLAFLPYLAKELASHGDSGHTS
jgi:5-methylcytosine-specific restriction endonuclease McrA